ncbi:lipocalin family protein [Candidatus Saccharibacteria bacterium]|nr:lipocalin family protein [Candidatus Saccharibacteria bacterium]
MQNTKNKGLLAGIVGGAVAIVAIVAIILVLIITGAKADLVGTWKMKSMTEKGKEYNTSQLEVLGYDGSITFREDGAGTFSMTGKTGVPFEYDKEKSTMTIGNETIELKVSGSTLTFEYDSIGMSFEKE